MATKQQIVTNLISNDDASFKQHLTPCTTKGVNDFTIPFYRDAYDYCDGYYVTIKVGTKYNVVFYDWSQYSGDHYKIVSPTWLKKIYLDQSYEGTTVKYKSKYNHYEYDCNSGRFCVGTFPTLVKVETSEGFNFLNLNRRQLMFAESFKSIIGTWKDRKITAERHDGTKVVLTTSGGIMDATKDYKAQLEACKKMTKQQVADLWVAKGRPCVYSYGLWNSDDGKQLSREEAMAKIKNYSFGTGFYSLRWIISQRLGEVALCFKECSASDMY